MKKWMFVACILLAGCTSTKERPPQEEAVSTDTEPVQSEEVIATQMQIPWNITKASDRFIISQRGGSIVLIGPDDTKEETRLHLKQEIAHEGEGGLLGFVLDPDFSKNRLAYVYHTYNEESRIQNRIIQVRYEGDGWHEIKELLSGIPGGSIHNGGRLAIGPDNKLYATAGDAGEARTAQEPEVLSGKILRMNLDGSIPEDNPFSQSYVYTLGHRNPQGMAWDERGRMYAAEHGQRAHDEINLIEPGRNYGWPIIEGDEQQEGMEIPLFHSGEETWAPSGMDYQDGKLFVAALRGEKLLVFDLEHQTEEVFYSGAGRLRDVYIDDNSLYVITNNTDGRGNPSEEDDRLIRLPLSRSE
ncbi:PQQ-dependent sugar dehydrogenase [Bacillus thermotolerans]|uniref:PQQ-dependent sugar dehydrogenase n=1 Tax=Bacillus thermotolerans TaxID=1221996 RepID=UPI00057D5406|nr:PQQ-dependent sugar dehydrogenase [Bacillus thermotolerans]KKB38476.1 hypothetical protein QY97_02385 [Bacillus thermotolerans]KKB39543.1 hypothetical protein QY96_02790 [Bacillus thermotolerans]